MPEGFKRRDDMTCRVRGQARPGREAPECGGPLCVTRRAGKGVVCCERCGNVVEGHALLADVVQPQTEPVVPPVMIPAQDYPATVPDRVTWLEKAYQKMLVRFEAMDARGEALEARINALEEAATRTAEDPTPAAAGVGRRGRKEG